MQKEMNFGTASLLVVSAVLAVLFIVPDVGWMIRQQARILVGGPTVSVTNPPNQAEEAVLRENPRDYQLQLGGAFYLMDNPADVSDDEFNATNQQIVAKLQALQIRFPSEPSLPAHILRFLCTNQYLIYRKELPGNGTCFSPPVAPPELLETVATQGESLDPTNAFFPTLLAIAYFEQERDTEARNALVRAARKPRWNDYVSEEIQARWKLLTAAHGETSALRKFLIHRMTMFPHYGPIRSLARIVAVQATEMELRGKTVEGLALRQVLSRIGARLRADSPTVADSRLGGEVTAISASRPDGAPLLTYKEVPDSRKCEEMNRDCYLAYLQRIGATAEAKWYANEWTRILKVETIYNKALDKTHDGSNELTPLILSWFTGILLLVNTLWILLFGGLAVLLSRTRRIQEGQPLSRGMTWGVGYAVVGPLLVYGINLLVNMLSPESAAFVFLGAPLLTGLLILPLFFLKRGTDWRGYGRNMGGFLVALVSPLVLVSLFPLSLGGILQSDFYDSLFSPFYLIPDGPLFYTITRSEMPLPLSPGVLPALCLVSLAAWSWRQKVPVSVGVVRGFKRMSLPLASLLLLAYAFMVIFTLHSEIVVTESLQERVSHEGRCLARVIGEEWPPPSDYRLPPIK